MLYDNALITQIYAELFQITNEERYLQIVQKTLEYVIREMTSPDGGFYSSQDADSEGVEGKSTMSGLETKYSNHLRTALFQKSFAIITELLRMVTSKEKIYLM